MKRGRCWLLRELDSAAVADLIQSVSMYLISDCG